MSNFKHTISRILTSTTAAAALLMATASCSMMHDNLDECTRELRVTFSYDMNMKFADAFPSQVKTVTLYAYDAQGKLAMQKTESTDDIKARGGYMELDGMEPGKYTLKVWAEGEQRHADSYTYGQIGRAHV